MPVALRRSMAARASALGFDAFGVTTPDAFDALHWRPAEALQDFIAHGRHGDMDWMERHRDRRADPRTLLDGLKSIVIVAASYAPEADPLNGLAEPERGLVSVYARGKDYHDVMKARLKQLARELAALIPCDARLFVDTAPLMEKPLAAAAGIGWQGKHTNLVSRVHGSWLFLGALLTTAEIAADTPEGDHCGSCRRCLDICPTAAFPTPYQLDARRCIAYLTIEHKGHIDREFRRPIANRVFGCDDCLAVCPWNKFAEASREVRFHGRAETDNPPLRELLGLDDAAFRSRFAGTPVKRTGRDRFMRNVLIAVANRGDPDDAKRVMELLDDPSALVRAMAVWALAHVADADTFDCERAKRIGGEADAHVAEEWRTALRP